MYSVIFDIRPRGQEYPSAFVALRQSLIYVLKYRLIKKSAWLGVSGEKCEHWNGKHE